MPSIPDQLNVRLCAILRRSKIFDSAHTLRTVFTVASIAPWSAIISDDPMDRAARVNALIADLHDQANARDENALILFLHVLLSQGHIPPHTADHRDLTALLQELELALNPSLSRSPYPSPLTPTSPPPPPLVVPELPQPSMNLKTELAAFWDIVTRQDSHTHTILAHGESGMGKTFLLNIYRHITDTLNIARLDFDLAPLLSVEACMDQIVSYFGLSHFPNYTNYVADGPPAPLTREAEARWQQTFTRHFFIDLSVYTAAPRLVLFFDQYEKADRTFKDWFARVFLPHISVHIPLIIVVAGQEEVTPCPSGRHCQYYHLHGVTAECYHYYATALKVPLDPKMIDSFHALLRGRPRDFALHVQALALGEEL